MNYDAEWTRDCPKEIGFYWFFGYPSRKAQNKGYNNPELILVKVQEIGGGGLVYIANGSFLWESELGDGLWTPSMMPELPNLESYS